MVYLPALLLAVCAAVAALCLLRPRPRRRQPRCDTAAAGMWWHSPLASASEHIIVSGARVQLLAQDAEATTEPHLDTLLLRRCRGNGFGRNGAHVEAETNQLVSAVAESLKWRRAHALPLAPLADSDTYCAARELAHGQWAASYLEVGLRCGRSLGGHPVKIERPGRHDVRGIENYRCSAGEAKGELLLREYYYAMLEDMCAACSLKGSSATLALLHLMPALPRQRTLDRESAASGQLLKSYEVFDMEGLSWSNLTSLPVLRVSRGVLRTFSHFYPETTVRTAIINAPAWCAAPGPIYIYIEI